jgi:hypothetical protein
MYGIFYAAPIPLIFIIPKHLSSYFTAALATLSDSFGEGASIAVEK